MDTGRLQRRQRSSSETFLKYALDLYVSFFSFQVPKYILFIYVFSLFFLRGGFGVLKSPIWNI